MAISLNPYIAVSWIPIGKIKFNPLLYATFIALDKTSSDTLRIIHNHQSINADSLRKTISNEIINVESYRLISANQTVISDSCRNILPSQNFYADTLRRVTRPQGNIIISPFICASIELPDILYADTLRRISNSQSILFDTLILFQQSFSVDTNRTLLNSEYIDLDTNRQINTTSTIDVDTVRQLKEILFVDSYRQIINSQTCQIDTTVRLPYILNFFVKSSPIKLLSSKKIASKTANNNIVSLMNTLKDFGIISLNLSLNAMSLTDSITIESTRCFNINDALQGQLFNYFFNFLIETTIERNSLQTVNGMYNKDQLLYTQIKFGQYELGMTLTEYDIYTIRQMVPAANLLFNMNIENDGKIILASTTNERGEVKTSFTYYYAPDGHKMNKNELLRYLVTQYAFSANYIKFIANALGLKTYININDFQNTQLSNYLNNYATYIEILQNAYSWSSKIPQRQINVFIRGDTLYVIQRGLETSTFDITNLPHIIVSTERKLLRTIWQQELIKEKWSTTEIDTDLDDPNNPDNNNDDEDDDNDEEEEDDDDDYDEDEDDDYEDNAAPYSGSISYEEPIDNGSISMTIKYENGLMQSNSKNITVNNSDTGTTTTTTSKTTYSYNHYYPQISGQPSTKQKNKNKNKKSQKPAVYSNKKAFDKALKQWYKQQDKAMTQYLKQLNKLQHQRQKALNQLNNRSPIYFLDSEETEITTTIQTEDGTETNKQKIKKFNYYDGIGDSTYLFEERELTTTSSSFSSNNSSSDSNNNYSEDEESSVRQTFHSPVGNGYYAHTQYLDGEFQSASLSQGKPFQQVTQFTADQIQKGWSKSNSGSSGSGNGLEPPDIGPAPIFEPEAENNQNPNPAGNSPNEGTHKSYSTTYEVEIDSSFPTNNKDVAIELENALHWLNRKIQETITVEIYGEVINSIPEVQHICDFNERIIFNGNSYFLDSNNIFLSHNKLSQTLKIVRWF